MSLEIELKIKIDDPAPLRDRLAACGATPVSRVAEENHIFDRADQSLYAAGCGLRVRATTDLDTPGPQAGTLTFKGEQQPGPYKARTELEVGVDRPATACAILEALGYVRVLFFEKRRETWRLGDCTVELDEVPRLGWFVEVEGPTEAVVTATAQTLSLDVQRAIKDTYIALLIDDATATGRSNQDIRFLDASPNERGEGI